MKKGFIISLIALALAGCGDDKGSHLDQASAAAQNAHDTLQTASAQCGAESAKLCAQITQAQANLTTAQVNIESAKHDDDMPWYGFIIFFVVLAVFGML